MWDQWFLNYKHGEPLGSFPRFCRTPFLSNTTESNNGLLKSDDLRRTPEAAPSNPRGSIEPSLRATVLDLQQNKNGKATHESILQSISRSLWYVPVHLRAIEHFFFKRKH